MARLVWGAFGERYYETGVDRGVFFNAFGFGYAWSGLISVSESPSGGEARPYYLDGVKYQNLSASEEFEATINAFSAPKEFGPYDGNALIQNGLIITQQPRKSFGLSYRSMLGNDVEGSDHGYKIHIVYNALAAPSQRTRRTLGETVDPDEFSWLITTKPPALTGYKPSAHFVIDSRYADPTALATFEDILYGTEAESARLPDVNELIDIFTP